MFKWVIKQEKLIKIIIPVFYIIGGIGMVVPSLSSFIIKLTPMILILSFILLMMFHCVKINKSTVLIFLLIYVISFVIEVYGVNTGLIFGKYVYGQTLGPKIFNTPVIIGLNWVLLTYLTSSIMEKYNIGNFLKVSLASLLMLVYDLILECAAPLLDMWRFSEDVVPMKNYIGWLIIALLFHTIFKIYRVSTVNRLSTTLFYSQLIFLIIITILIR